jgi:AAA+ superfamily predicted ATPase
VNIDLSADLRRSYLDALGRAKRSYDQGEDAKAADAYEAASRLALELAEAAPDRAAELSLKKDAVKYRDWARRLIAGDVPPPEDRVAPREASTADDDGTGDTLRAHLASATRSGPRGVPPGSPLVTALAQAVHDKVKGGAAAAGGPGSAAGGPGGARGPGRPALSRKGDDDEKDGIGAAVAQLVTSSPITWDQIGGLEDVKREIKLALALSVARPPAGVQIPNWRNILFYGPPGTGKTLLAAATSNALRTNASDATRAVFFNVKVSSVMSKYFGESTKIVSELYGQARDASPAVIFLDEFESLAGHRDADDSGPERRILSTILAELDGLSEKGRKDIYVLTIAATNRPWDLDPAVLSRFEKKILIPLPDAETRRAILGILLEKKGFRAEAPLEELVEMTAGFSGREIERFVKEVTTRMIAETNAGLPALVDQGLEAVRSYQVRVRTLERGELAAAKRRITPQTTPEEMERYAGWKESEAV